MSGVRPLINSIFKRRGQKAGGGAGGDWRQEEEEVKSGEKEGDGRGREEEDYRQPLPDFLHGDKAVFNRPGCGAKSVHGSS